MYGTGTKKMLNMLILDVLKEYSDSEHRLLQQDIIDHLENDYGISCERRSVKSNIVSLRDMGYKIKSDKGYYLETREFSDAELRLLIDSIFTSGAITNREAHQLAKKLEKFSNKFFKSHLTSITAASGNAGADVTGEITASASGTATIVFTTTDDDNANNDAWTVGIEGVDYEFTIVTGTGNDTLVVAP